MRQLEGAFATHRVCARLTQREPDLANLALFQLFHAREVTEPAKLLTPDPQGGLRKPLCAQRYANR